MLLAAYTSYNPQLTNKQILSSALLHQIVHGSNFVDEVFKCGLEHM